MRYNSAMKWTEKLIVTIAESIILRPKLENHPLYEDYQRYLPVIKSSIDQAAFWHGTGRYHYQLLGMSKYEGVDFVQTYDVLQAIINAGGISPCYDPVVGVNGEFLNSVSLTPYRMYGRAYAEFNQYKEHDFEYVFGGVRFWFYFLASLQMIEGDFLHNIRSVLKSTKNKQFVEKTQPWTDTLRKRDPNTKWTALNFYKVRSDIPENYGMLFGIKEYAVEKVSFNKTIERFETRARNKITLEDITHIEVTNSKVKEVTQKLQENNYNIPVIPIELGELYCSQFKLKTLSGVV